MDRRLREGLRRRRKAALVLCARLAPITLAVGLGCGNGDQYRPLRAGDPAPAYAAPTLDGDTIALSELRGQAVLVNIWATWCAPCREEMPDLQALYERYRGRGLRILGVSTDAPGSEEPIRYFVNETGVSFTILLDPADVVSRRFRATGVPETFLIDTKGRIAHHWFGRFDPLADDAIRRIEDALSADR